MEVWNDRAHVRAVLPFHLKRPAGMESWVEEKESRGRRTALRSTCYIQHTQEDSTTLVPVFLRLIYCQLRLHTLLPIAHPPSYLLILLPQRHCHHPAPDPYAHTLPHSRSQPAACAFPCCTTHARVRAHDGDRARTKLKRQTTEPTLHAANREPRTANREP